MKINIIKAGRVETVELTQFQKNIYDSIRKEKCDIFNISKSRQVGVSIILAYYCLERLFLSKQANVLIRSHTNSNSERFINLIKSLYEINFKQLTNQQFDIDRKDTLRVGNVIVTTNINMFKNNYPIELILDEYINDYNKDWVYNLRYECKNFDKVIISCTGSVFRRDDIEFLFRGQKCLSQINLEEHIKSTFPDYLKLTGSNSNNKEDIIKLMVENGAISDSDFRKIVNILYGTN